jgi:hypothetical protein
MYRLIFYLTETEYRAGEWRPFSAMVAEVAAEEEAGVSVEAFKHSNQGRFRA